LRPADLRSAHARHRDHRLRAVFGGGSSPCGSERGGPLPSIEMADALLDERESLLDQDELPDEYPFWAPRSVRVQAVAGELADVASVDQPAFCPRLAVMFRSAAKPTSPGASVWAADKPTVQSSLKSIRSTTRRRSRGRCAGGWGTQLQQHAESQPTRLRNRCCNPYKSCATT